MEEKEFTKVKLPLMRCQESDAKLDYVMYVDTISHVANDGQVESFTLHLVSREAITNERQESPENTKDRQLTKLLNRLYRY